MALKKLIRQLEKEYLRPTISQDEVDDIEKGVAEFVKLVTDEVAKMEKLFTVKRIIKVGSFYEKTKVGNPDEFDFLLELDGMFEMEKVCKSHPCSTYVKTVAPVCTNETDLRAWGVISPDGFLPAQFTYLRWKCLIEEVFQKMRARENSLDKIQCKLGHLTIDTDVVLGTGPNVECRLIWHGEKGNFGIGIDMCICVPCTDEFVGSWKTELLPLDFSVVPKPVLVVPSTFRMHMSYLGRCCSPLYGRPCYLYYWNMSMAQIEVDTIRNIPEPYRLCYLVLKWIFMEREHHEMRERSLSSYMLKNAVLSCQASCRQSEPARCLEEVFQYLRACCDKNCLPAYFMPKVNLWLPASDGQVGYPRKGIWLLSNYLFKTLKKRNPENFNFDDVRARIWELQLQCERMDWKPVPTETRSRSSETLKGCCLPC